MYGFILNMWIMREVDEEFVNLQVEMGRITKKEKELILKEEQI